TAKFFTACLAATSLSRRSLCQQRNEIMKKFLSLVKSASLIALLSCRSLFSPFPLWQLSKYQGKP
ncbi:hypothetical protein, partial [Achromobacter sp. HZ01]|uniref:hypothetical protein n=1 Tax=Achromobacter sp. HZ01 TaxID=1416886 RepID=UPI001AEF940A